MAAAESDESIAALVVTHWAFFVLAKLPQGTQGRLEFARGPLARIRCSVLAMMRVTPSYAQQGKQHLGILSDLATSLWLHLERGQPDHFEYVQTWYPVGYERNNANIRHSFATLVSEVGPSNVLRELLPGVEDMMLFSHVFEHRLSKRATAALAAFMTMAEDITCVCKALRSRNRSRSSATRVA